MYIDPIGGEASESMIDIERSMVIPSDGTRVLSSQLITEAKSQFQVQATGKKAATDLKTFLTTERFELSGSAHMDSAMKPVRLASIMSEDATPLS